MRSAQHRVGADGGPAFGEDLGGDVEGLSQFDAHGEDTILGLGRDVDDRHPAELAGCVNGEAECGAVGDEAGAWSLYGVLLWPPCSM